MLVPPTQRQVGGTSSSHNTANGGGRVNGFGGGDDVVVVVNDNGSVQRQIPIGIDDLPRVVRGSILIRNAIDTTGGPRHYDIVTDENSASPDLVIEDNTNMFDERYRQSRENPVYRSDEDEDVIDAAGRLVTSRVAARRDEAAARGRPRPGSGGRRTAEEVFREERQPLTGSARVNGRDGGALIEDDFDMEIPIQRSN